MAPCECPLCAAFVKHTQKPVRTRSARRKERERLKKQMNALFDDDDAFDELMRYKFCRYVAVASAQAARVRDLQDLLAGEYRERTYLESALKFAWPVGDPDRDCRLCGNYGTVIAHCGHVNFCASCWTSRRHEILHGNQCLHCTKPNNWACEYAELAL